MKNLFRFSYIILLLLATTACDDEKEYDVKGVKDLSAYIKVQSGIGVNNYGGNASIIHTPISEVGENTEYTFAVNSNLRAKSDVKVALVFNADLVNQYNEKHDTNYTALDADTFASLEIGYYTTIEPEPQTPSEGDTEEGTETPAEPAEPETIFTPCDLTAIIEAGEISSRPITIRIPESIFATLTEPNYMFALQIENVVGGKIASNEGLDRIYFTIDTCTKLVQSAPTQATFDSFTLLTERSNYVVYNGAGEVDTNGSWLFDSNSSKRFTARPIIVDLGETINFIGVKVCAYYSNYYPINKFEIEHSTDGVDYTSVGAADGDAIMKGDDSLGSGWSTFPYQYIALYAPVQARYLRINYTTTNSWSNYGICDLFFFTK